MIETIIKRRADNGVVVIFARHSRFGDDVSIKCDRKLVPSDASFIERAVKSMIDDFEKEELPLFYPHKGSVT